MDMYERMVSMDLEQKVMRIVKLVNLKIVGGVFECLKDVFLPDGHFMARCSITR